MNIIAKWWDDQKKDLAKDILKGKMARLKYWGVVFSNWEEIDGAIEDKGASVFFSDNLDGIVDAVVNAINSETKEKRNPNGVWYLFGDISMVEEPSMVGKDEDDPPTIIGSGTDFSGFFHNKYTDIWLKITVHQFLHDGMSKEISLRLRQSNSEMKVNLLPYLVDTTAVKVFAGIYSKLDIPK